MGFKRAQLSSESTRPWVRPIQLAEYVERGVVALTVVLHGNNRKWAEILARIANRKRGPRGRDSFPLIGRGTVIVNSSALVPFASMASTWS